jgi:hypothetical protein
VGTAAMIMAASARMALGRLGAVSLKLLLLRWVGRAAMTMAVLPMMALGKLGVAFLKLPLLDTVGRAAMAASVAATLPTSAAVASTAEVRRLPNPLSAAWVDGGCWCGILESSGKRVFKRR